MALKNWGKHIFPLKSLVDGVADNWTLSAGGTAEYYYNVGDLLYKPNKVVINGAETLEGTTGTLAAGTWSWGNNDGLANDTLYVRLSDGTDPDTKTLDYIQSTTAYTVLDAIGPETIVLSVLLSNISTEDSFIEIFHTNDLDDIIFKWLIGIPATNSPFALDSKIVVGTGHKIKVMSSVEEFSVLMSGDES